MVVTEEMKQQVKDEVLIPDYVTDVIVPEMPWYFNDYIVDLDLKPVIKCPLHGEDTPSFRYYAETNTYYCWGCGSGGDVIQLHKEFMLKVKDVKISFNESVGYLYENFLSGNTNKGVKKILPKKKAEEIAVDNQKVLMFKHVYLDTERKLQKTRELGLEEKKIVYEAIDNASRLVEMALLSPQDGINYIRNTLQQVIQQSREKLNNVTSKEE